MNYRGLNKSTIDMKCPLPIFNGLVDQLSGAMKFLNFDLKIGDNQIITKECHIEKMAFHRDFGHHEYMIYAFWTNQCTYYIYDFFLIILIRRNIRNIFKRRSKF